MIGNTSSDMTLSGTTISLANSNWGSGSADISQAIQIDYIDSNSVTLLATPIYRTIVFRYQ